MSEYLIPVEGQHVIIERGIQQRRAMAMPRQEDGSFWCVWLDGDTPDAAPLAGYWYSQFGPEGEPLQGWRIVVLCDLS